MEAHSAGRLGWRRAVLAALVAVGLVAGAGSAPALTAPGPAQRQAAPEAPGQRLTNLAHLDHLLDDVVPPEQGGHSTYGRAEEPIVMPWTYAEPDPDDPGGPYRRVGGGSYDAASDTYGQGAFNADDIARAAVVYVRHFRQHGDQHSLRSAKGLLRALTYLQTSSGPDAGNVVLWMQPDGTLNPSADPKEEPDPSDSAPSYWLARTVWALGEGYGVFQDADPGFGSFLRDRLQLAVDAVDRQILQPRYGTYRTVDGRRTPAWLIADGADATGEAVLGLSAYVRAGGSGDARRVLRQLAEGVARQSAGDETSWPFGAILPWARSRTMWHGWGGLAPAALAAASEALEDRSLIAPAVADTAGFTTHLLVAGGPDNGWLPTPADRSQIAYGADSRVEDLLAVAEAGHRPGLRQVAGFAASWYFGNNRAGVPVYDPATGRTFDGVGGDAVVNHNSGAESTIHGLLTMLALDAAPEAAEAARVATVSSRNTWRLSEAEDATVTGAGRVVTPESAWTGEGQWSGGKYVALTSGDSVGFEVPADDQDRLVLPVVQRTEDASGGRSDWTGGGRALGSVRHAGAGEQGDSAVSGTVEMLTLPRPLPAKATGLRATAYGPAVIDAVLTQPLVEHVVLGDGAGHGRALLRSFATDRRTRSVAVPGEGPATVSAYDSSGRLVARAHATGRSVPALVVPGGFTVVER